MQLSLSWASALVAAALLQLSDAIYINGSVIAPCDSPIYCYGEILKQVELARPFVDSKTFVDLPTIKPLNEVIAAFNKLEKPLSNNTALHAFLTTYFGPAGGELVPVNPASLHSNPVFLKKLNNSILQEFGQKVVNIWPDLTRKYGGPATTCDGCVDSFIEVNRTFIIAGGRFKEIYYWDSYWIIEGLLRSGGSFIGIAKEMIENFFDLLDLLGFIPNGTREYYRNRSHPPLLAAMVRSYLELTNDTSIVPRAITALEKEHYFFMTNRTVTVLRNGHNYTLNRYNVQNTQPRPESFFEDYQTVTNKSYFAKSGIIYPEVKPLTDAEKATLYGNLASGAESGWDFGSRWMRTPQDAVLDNYFPLRSLNTKNTVPVELNAFLYLQETVLSNLYLLKGDRSASHRYAQMAQKRQQAMTAVFWNSTHLRFFDYNLTSSAQNVHVFADPNASASEKAGSPPGQMVYWEGAQIAPFWTGAAPNYLRNNPYVVLKAFEPVARHLDMYAGGMPASNLITGQQWDEPNAWPPLQFMIMKGLGDTKAIFGTEDPYYKQVQNLALRVGQRYVDSTFCTWWATGGSAGNFTKKEGVLPGANGIMFEKYSSLTTNSAGGGGEYAVVEGFGWSNGALLWTLDRFGAALKTPLCSNNTLPSAMHRRMFGKRAVEIDHWDAKFTKMYKR